MFSPDSPSGKLSNPRVQDFKNYEFFIKIVACFLCINFEFRYKVDMKYIDMSLRVELERISILKGLSP